MTAKSFRTFLEKFEFIELSKIYQAHNDYYSYDGWSKGKERTRYFTYCHELIEDMVEGHAEYEEFERAIIFSYVVLDSEKFKLNILKAKDFLNIQELYVKYVLGVKEGE